MKPGVPWEKQPTYGFALLHPPGKGNKALRRYLKMKELPSLPYFRKNPAGGERYTWNLKNCRRSSNSARMTAPALP